ncbi:hypothetical protein PVAG01_11244 [Phlyctema vagabunda]|uniref:Uncharacterized protein n=1 Tax=Phlyctema vagabunda TaxID=108571 RepID=A0ABR4P1S2_9HELO
MFGVYSLSTNGHVYALLNNDEESGKQTSRSPENLTSRLMRSFILLLVLSGVGGLGFFVGRRSAPMHQEKEDDFRLGTISQILEYNATFAESSNASNVAWKALIPHHGGFFNHPTLAPQRSVFSVFHQLHCLVRLPFPHLQDCIVSIDRMACDKAIGPYTRR